MTSDTRNGLKKISGNCFYEVMNLPQSLDLNIIAAVWNNLDGQQNKRKQHFKKMKCPSRSTGQLFLQNTLRNYRKTKRIQCRLSSLTEFLKTLSFLLFPLILAPVFCFLDNNVKNLFSSKSLAQHCKIL